MYGTLSREAIKRTDLMFQIIQLFRQMSIKNGNTFFKNLLGLNMTKMVIIVRTDLKMGRGKVASQAAHAAILLYQYSIKNDNPYLKTWTRYGQPKVILKVETDCASALTDIYQRASNNNLIVCKVFDAGRTQVAEGTLTAVGIGPSSVEEIDKITGCLKLL